MSQGPCSQRTQLALLGSIGGKLLPGRSPIPELRGSPRVAQRVKNLPAMPETWVLSPGWENPLEEGLAIHSSILAGEIPMDRGAW